MTAEADLLTTDLVAVGILEETAAPRHQFVLG
jgi:hypothetical protein